MRPRRPTLHAALLATCALVPAAFVPAARAADPAPIHIAVISDQDDDIYDARSGRGGVDATRMAVADFGGQLLGRPVVVDALNDHNKAAEAGPLATQALDNGADLLMDIQDTPEAMAVAKIANERHRIAMSTGSAAPALTRGACGKYVYHYSFDAPAIETATAAALSVQPGGKRWAAIVADAGFGKGALATMTPIIEAAGGQVAKSFLVPSTTTDLAAPLGEINDLAPDVIAVFNAGADNDREIAAVTAAHLSAQITTALLYISDVERAKPAYSGVKAAVPWYWDLDTEARAWSDRFAGAHGGRRPTAAQAADYSATTQWLEAVRTAGTIDADAVVKALDSHHFEDMFARNAEFRATDHMVIHDLYIVKVRQPNELPEDQAWYEVLQTVPAAVAFPPTSGCKM